MLSSWTFLTGCDCLNLKKHLLTTGHVALNTHLTVRKIHIDQMCLKCGEEKEKMQCHDDSSLFHIVISPNGYHGTSTSSTRCSFEVWLWDLYNLSIITGLCNGPKLITASALDSMLSSPKVKVTKVKVRTSIRPNTARASQQWLSSCSVYFIL